MKKVSSKHIVISLSKIRYRDWSYTRHVICTNDHCWPVQRTVGQHYRSTLHSRLIFGPNAISGKSIIYSALC